MLPQVIAVAIFIIMFGLVITEKIERHIVTLFCGLLTIVVLFGLCMRSTDAIMQTLNVRTLFTPEFWYNAGSSEDGSTGINWATILFIAGMMIMVEGMALVGFFRWLCMSIARLVKYKTIPVFITFMLMSAILSMFIDCITVILFLAAVTVELGRLLKFNPVPMILSEIFCANLGGAATMCGDPPNIIIGTSLGYTFADFVVNTGVIVLVALILVVVYFYFFFRKELTANNSDIDIANMPDPKKVITNKKGFIIHTLIFFLAVALLVTHAMTGLTVAFIGVFIALLTLIAAGKKAPTLIAKADYKTLLFFIGLFVVVGGLEQTGILEIISAFIGKISGGNPRLIVAIIIWISAVASAFIDNIPFAATMVPVIKSLAETENVSLAVLAWALSMGTDIGGNATPIGASANVVGTSVAAKKGYPISWRRYCVSLVPPTIMVLVAATLMIWFRYL